MRYLGILLLVFSAFWVYKKYASYLAFSIEECEGYTQLTEQLYGKVSCYLSPQNEVIMNFECPALERCGFLPEVRRRRSARDAFLAVMGNSQMPKDAKEAVKSLFLGLGKGYLDSEIKAMELCLEKLRKITEREKGELEARRRVAGALTFAAAAGLALLFI